MTYRKRSIFFTLLLAAAVLRMPAQTVANTSTAPATKWPQWARDLRRGEIVLFGSFPFAMFTATFFMDMDRWSKANNMDWSDEGRRYAPWPLKSAGAIAMDSSDQELTITVAVSLSAAIAVADYIIVLIKRDKARRKAEALPVGSSIIIRTPLPSEVEDGSAGSGDAAPAPPDPPPAP